MDEHRTLIVAAHPDDETIGAGIRMARCKRREAVTIAHLTAGSPRDRSDARAAGCATGAAYARVRRQELYAAPGLAGIRPEQCRELGFVDQETHLHLTDVVDRVAALIGELRPELILTHPYEGGHPDHDAAAFAVAGALKLRPGAAHEEFASYRAGPHGVVNGAFLPAGSQERVLILTEAERGLKAAMFAAFRTQHRILKLFPLDTEKFRTAPTYDFMQPPHAGELQYERFGFGIGIDWRRRAAEALQSLNRRAWA